MFDCLTKPWLGGTEFQSTSNDDNWRYVIVEERSMKPKKASSEPTDLLVETTVPTQQRRVGRRLKVMRYNRATSELSSPESIGKISTRCFGLLVTTPLFALARMVYYAARLIFEVIKTTFQAFWAIGKQTAQDGLITAIIVNVKDFAIKGTLRFLANLWEVIRTPYYALGIEIAALEGAFVDPLKGSRKVAHIETTLNHTSYMTGILRRARDIDVRELGIFGGRTIFIHERSFQPFGAKDDILDTYSNTPRFKVLTDQFESRSELLRSWRSSQVRPYFDRTPQSA